MNETHTRHKFNKGDIVYWCHQHGHEYTVRWGMVDEQFSDLVYVDFLEPRERRLVNGIPIDEFESETRYKKLPKGWTYSTDLFEITYSPLSDEESETGLIIDNPDTIKSAYDKGFLVRSKEIYHGVIEAEITKEGYRIVRKYPMWKHHQDYTTVLPSKLYFTYEEAKKEVDDNIAEFTRQASLSDYDWSLEQIDKILKRYKNLTGMSDSEMQQYHDWLVDRGNVEDIETRIFDEKFQWKYWKNKKWNYVEL